MSFQPLFRQFEEKIKLKRFDENAELIEKRDRVLKKIRDNLSMKFEWFNQGSYAMGTGVKPLNGDYDIDIGIVLPIDRSKYDPVTVKGWVYKAVETHTTKVEWRRPCITVYYQHEKEAIYHVDLAILAKDPNSGALHLAIGKQNSAKEQQEWQKDDRKGFMDAVEKRFSNSDDMAQLRRVIRYLKRWKDFHFASEGRSAPTGLALTVAAYHLFQPAKVSYSDPTYDDLAATTSLVQAVRQRFTQVWDAPTQRHTYRMSLQFPCAPNDDLMARMSNEQQQQLYQRLEKLSGWLADARKNSTVTSLRSAFGTDFPEK